MSKNMAKMCLKKHYFKCRKGVEKGSQGGRKPGLGVGILELFRIILKYLRQKCTKLNKLPTPPTPCRHHADTLGVEHVWLNNLWYKLSIRDRYSLFTKADTFLYFSANVIKKNKNTLLGVDT